jgi:solute carrier family 25 (mitochondrial carnitine/acylcarnitine transporter), member 20/29
VAVEGESENLAIELLLCHTGSFYLSLPPFFLFASSYRSVAYWTLSYPLDIIKSAIQADAIDPKDRKYKGIVHTATTLWKEGGMKRYTAGLTPCLARSFPANAAGFAAYEMVKAHLEKPKTAE